MTPPRVNPEGERSLRDPLQVGQQEHVHEAAGLLLPPRQTAEEVRLEVEEERTGPPISGAVHTAQGHRGSGQAREGEIIRHCSTALIG